MGSAEALLSCVLKKEAFKEIPLVFDYQDNSRGLGVADMAKALRCGRGCRADCSQTLHVLEIMTAFEKSSREGHYMELETSYERRAPPNP